MGYLEDVKEMLCRELEIISRRGEIKSLTELEAIDKLTHSLKSVETILAMDNYSYDEGYSNSGYKIGRPYSNRGRSMSYNNGYSSKMMYDMDYNGRSDGYSRHDAKEQMLEQLRETMKNSSSEETKEAIRKAIQMMEKEK